MKKKLYIDKPISWWITTPKRQKRALNARFGKDFVDFIEHFSLPCYSKMTDPSYTLWEKVIWFGVHAFFTFLLIIFLSDAWSEFASQYFSTTLSNPSYPIEKVPFPAVSICSNNRISRRAAEKYAIELTKCDPEKRNVSYFMDNIKLLGLLYNKDDYSSKIQEAYNFQQFLDTYNIEEDERYYNTLKRMETLTPSCSQLLIKCNLGGNSVKCCAKKAFQTVLTSFGYCCTFNENNIYNIRDEKHRFAQQELGLTVVLNTSSDDMFFPLLRIDGTVVIIHAANKYPDISSGGSSENFITNGEDNFLSITPFIIDSVPAVRRFDPETRKCYFKDESPSGFRKGRLFYSFNNCITQCRIKSILILCNCLPFNMPFELAPNGTKTVYCTLRHLECLERYRFKWVNVLTKKNSLPGLEREIEDALFCPQCLPSCKDIQYKVFLETRPLNPEVTAKYSGNNESDITVLKVFFADRTTKFYQKIVKNSWFEAFSTIGNFCGIFIGFSLIVFCEVGYFIALQISLAFTQNYAQKRKALIIYP